MAEGAKVVEYWETENFPSMRKNSPEFHDTLEGQLTPETLAQLNAHPFLSRDEIEIRQIERIQALVRIAYEKTDFYHHKYSEAGFEPEDLGRLSQPPLCD